MYLEVAYHRWMHLDTYVGLEQKQKHFSSETSVRRLLIVGSSRSIRIVVPTGGLAVRLSHWLHDGYNKLCRVVDIDIESCRLSNNI